jgi:hypothetical protein
VTAQTYCDPWPAGLWIGKHVVGERSSVEEVVKKNQPLVALATAG